MNTDPIAYCGVDRAVCPDFTNRKCPGCRQTQWPPDDMCPPAECCRRQNIGSCGECSSFPCEMMKDFYTESESHERAYALMTTVHKKRYHV